MLMDGHTDGCTDGGTDGGKTGSFYPTMPEAGTTKFKFIAYTCI